MNIKRGRPKKIVNDEANELVSQKEETKSTYNPNETTAFKNKIFINKEGVHCTVMYSDCKDEPIIINTK
jgi:hypothetical protein